MYHITGHHDFRSPVAITPTLDNCSNSAWKISPRKAVGTHITESGWNRDSNAWLSQANHVLNRLGALLNAHDYALLDWVRFRVELKSQSARPTDWYSLGGFLFLCPPESFQVGPASFKCPECVGYWSFDPSGVERLSAEQASELGFPCINISVGCWGAVWSDTIYAGLRQFHQGKGFDPDSQELARYLGVPLYQLYPDYEKSLNADSGEARIKESPTSDTDHSDQLVDAEQPVNLGIEDEKCGSVSQNRDLDEETMDVSSSLELLSQIQLGLILLLAILGVYDSL
ncbi:hypothetical protein R3P38DRAFT_3483294 [Favolaschia claudopus]|uniref:Uncharacterized protein n=1 Tax=Favolaschia claudopus TaxID=2862362 RepID=A0AAW0C9X8_9AGAR